MSKKVAVVWINLAIVFSFIVILVEIAQIVEAPAITIYVDDDYTPATPGWGVDHFDKIQDAIDNASQGDTVFVYNGTYYENVVVDKTINLTGEDRSNTTINGSSSGDVVYVTADWVNITGFTITYGDTGISIDSSIENSITNSNISFNNNNGILLISSSGNEIIDNIASNNWEGILLDSSSGNKITNNNFSFNTRFCIHLAFSEGNIILSNNVSEGDYGIELMDNSNNNTIENNTALSNNVDGIRVSGSYKNNITDNEASQNDKAGIHLITSYQNNITGNNISLNIECGIFLATSSSNNVTDNNVLDDYNGIYVPNSDLNVIENNIIQGNSNCGIFLPWSSTLNNINNNTVCDNPGYGIALRLSSDRNNITNNKIYNNTNDGIHLYSCLNNSLVNNTIDGHKFYGISIQSSSENDVINNTVYSNDRGILLSSSSLNTMANNTIYNNNYGFYLSGSINNNLYHNNIINNMAQAFDDSNNGNDWNNSYPSGGNYWSDYIGIDLNSTPTQDVPPPDGIGDTPYVIDANSQDNYPLMTPFGNLTYLYEGWNLVSIPFIQSDTNLSYILSQINNSYDTVWWYNTSDKKDNWKVNNTSKPFSMTDLDAINHKMGFWIHITKPGGVLYKYPGTQPTSNHTIQLFPGWNLVGYPSKICYNRTFTLNNINSGDEVDAIWTYNSATQKWEEINEQDYFELGRGYWIHSKVKKVWDVPL